MKWKKNKENKNKNTAPKGRVIFRDPLPVAKLEFEFISVAVWMRVINILLVSYK